MTQHSLHFFSAKEVAEAVSMKEAIELMKDAFTQLSQSEAIIPQRLSLNLSDKNDVALFMPVYSPKGESFGIKTVSIFHDNPAQGLPTIQAMVFVMDAVNGRPLAIMDGEYLTALRTGAASGLATDLLARQNAETVAIFGAGVQGQTQLEGVCAVRNIQKCYVFNRGKEKAEIFAKVMSAKLDIEVEVSDNPKNLQDVDIICTATNSKTPVFKDKHLKEGVHINAIGAYNSQMSEVPIETVSHSKIVVDQKSACLSEAGDLIKALEAKAITKDDLYAELGEIVIGKKVGRINEAEITLFKSVGNAIQDLITANQVFKNAKEKGIGTKLFL